MGFADWNLLAGVCQLDGVCWMKFAGWSLLDGGC